MPDTYEVVIIAYKNRQLLRTVIAEVYKQSVQPQKITVVDNGGDVVEADLPQECGAISLISRPDNPGYAAAVNELRGRMVSDYLLVLTHDVELAEDCVARLLTAAEETLEPCIVAPTLFFSSEKSTLYSAGGEVGIGGRVRHLQGALGLNQDASYIVDWADGAVLLLSVDLLDTVGWFDEDYFLYFEEVDFCTRAKKAGYKTVLAPRAIAYQEPGNFSVYLQIRNTLLFAKRNSKSMPVAYLIAMALALKATLKAITAKDFSIVWEAVCAIRDYRQGHFGRPNSN